MIPQGYPMKIRIYAQEESQIADSDWWVIGWVERLGAAWPLVVSANDVQDRSYPLTPERGVVWRVIDPRTD